VQVDIDLPQIAVIGSQSAGKSSLIEAISGITLPRAAGTCTRHGCPRECRLSRSDSPSSTPTLIISDDGDVETTVAPEATMAAVIPMETPFTTAVLSETTVPGESKGWKLEEEVGG